MCAKWVNDERFFSLSVFFYCCIFSFGLVLLQWQCKREKNTSAVKKCTKSTKCFSFIVFILISIRFLVHACILVHVQNRLRFSKFFFSLCISFAALSPSFLCVCILVHVVFVFGTLAFFRQLLFYLKWHVFEFLFEATDFQSTELPIVEIFFGSKLVVLHTRWTTC